MTSTFASESLCSLRSSPMAQRATRAGGRGLALVEDDLAVHDHLLDAFGVLERVFVCRAVCDAIRIEDRDVREHAGLDQAARAEAQLGGVE